MILLPKIAVHGNGEHREPPRSAHAEPQGLVQRPDDAETARVERIREMRRNNGDVSTYRARGLSWFSVFCVIANRMIGESFHTLQQAPYSQTARKVPVSSGHLTHLCKTLRVSELLCFSGSQVLSWHWRARWFTWNLA